MTVWWIAAGKTLCSHSALLKAQAGPPYCGKCSQPLNGPISARAGVTLCRVLAVHSEPGGRTFVAVDGGIGAKYPAVLANRHSVTPTGPVAVLGRHSDGGDEIARDVDLPTDIRAGDLLAVAGNGHAVPRPPLVAVSGGQARELVRRETVSDLLLRDTGSTPGPGQSTGASPRPSREN